jgi:S-adenosylmethionine hydrolase
MFCFSGLSYRKGWITKRHWKEINSLKQITELKASISHDTNMLKGHVVYIDHFGNVVTNISKRQFIEFAKGRPYEIIMKTKNIKTILPNYSAIASSDKYQIKNYEGENWLF